MTDKALKFLSSEDAINEVFLDLAVHPDKLYNLALFAKVYAFLTRGKARPGETDSNAENKVEKGIWVKTEMEKFRCTRCGHCCLKLHDAYCTSVDMEEVRRWRKEKRWDILERVDIMKVGGEELFADIWFSPTTGEDTTRCPWLRKLPNKNIYKCRIHEAKPSHCRNFPKSKKHALTTGCRGFGDNPTFDLVKRDLEKLYDNSQKKKNCLGASRHQAGTGSNQAGTKQGQCKVTAKITARVGTD